MTNRFSLSSLSLSLSLSLYLLSSWGGDVWRVCVCVCVCVVWGETHRKEIERMTLSHTRTAYTNDIFAWKEWSSLWTPGIIESVYLTSWSLIPKWYSGQGSQHTTWACLFARSIELTTLFTFVYYKFEFLSFVKINVTETVLLVHPSARTRWPMSMMPRFSETRGSARLSMG